MAEAMQVEPSDDAPSQRATAHELVRSTLRSAILRGTLPGGTRLRQNDIATQLQVSTTPVREALRDLATEGLVDLDPHRGAVVHELGLVELREVYDLRRVLEPVAMRRAAASLRPETLARADELQRRMDTETDLVAWVDLNRRFHATLLDDGDRPRLRGILRTLQDSAAPYVGLLLQNRARDPDEANAEHRELLDALRAGDGDRARRHHRAPPPLDDRRAPTVRRARPTRTRGHHVTDHRIPLPDLHAFVTAVYERNGLPAGDAATVASRMIEADIRGMDGHGVIRLPNYVRHLEAGGFNPRPDVQDPPRDPGQRPGRR